MRESLTQATLVAQARSKKQQPLIRSVLTAKKEEAQSVARRRMSTAFEKSILSKLADVD